jgi:hypothetical protein
LFSGGYGIENIVVFFRDGERTFTDLGFGSVFDGGQNFGQLGEISTQAVMELIQNCGSKEQEYVAVDVQDLENFCLPHAQGSEAEGTIVGMFSEIHVDLFGFCFI